MFLYDYQYVGCFFLNNNKVFKKKNNKNRLVGDCSYFVGSILVQVRHVFLQNYFLVFSLLKS